MSLLDLSNDLFYRLPPDMRRRFYPAVHRAGLWVRDWKQRRSDRRLPLRVLEHGGLRVLFVGDGAPAPYWLRLCFGEVEAVPRPMGTWQAGEVCRQVERNADQFDLVVVAMHRNAEPELRQKSFTLPNFVRQWIELPTTAEALDASIHANRETRKDRNKLLRNGFTYRISREERDVEEFYHTCHRPYILSRHGATAHVDSYREFRRYFLNDGELLMVWQHERMVSGVLMQQRDGVLHALLNGVLHADPELLQEGALAAEYYYSIVEAQRRGCTWQEMGRSRPFLNDGIVRFKKKWGCQVQPADDDPLEFHLMVGRWSPAVLRFLGEHPLLTRVRTGKQSGLAGCVFLTEDEDVSDKDLAGRLRLLHQPGACGMVLFPLSPGWRERCAALAGIHERIDFPLGVYPVPPHGEELPLAAQWRNRLGELADFCRVENLTEKSVPPSYAEVD
jgi:hypothetical protein